jgi:hypothetical protein
MARMRGARRTPEKKLIQNEADGRGEDDDPRFVGLGRPADGRGTTRRGGGHRREQQHHGEPPARDGVVFEVARAPHRDVADAEDGPEVGDQNREVEAADDHERVYLSQSTRR